MLGLRKVSEPENMSIKICKTKKKTGKNCKKKKKRDYPKTMGQLQNV